MPRYKSPNGTGRVGRDKKKKALESDEYKSNIEKLEDMGIGQEILDMIYYRCQEKPQTKIARDTLVSKLLELLNYFDIRNKGIDKSNSAFISKADAIEMIMRNPRIINSSIIVLKCQVLDKKRGSNSTTNIIIKSNPGIFRKTEKAILEGK